MKNKLFSFLSFIKLTLRLYKYRRLRKKYAKSTMVPLKTFANNLELICRFDNKKGSIVECGVWRGGMIAAISEIIGNNRKYYLLDSFEGLPKVKEIDGEAAKAWQQNTESKTYFDNCSAEQEFALEAMKQAGTTNYIIIAGWFSETLPNCEFEDGISILRLDGDWYESTMDCLNNLYDKVNTGGIIIFDDYYAWDGCSRAVHDFFSSRKLVCKIRQFNNDACYIIK